MKKIGKRDCDFSRLKIQTTELEQNLHIDV